MYFRFWFALVVIYDTHTNTYVSYPIRNSVGFTSIMQIGGKKSRISAMMVTGANGTHILVEKKKDERTIRMILNAMALNYGN